MPRAVGREASLLREGVSGFAQMHTGLSSLPIVLLLTACGGATTAPASGTASTLPPVTGLGPFQLGMSAVELRVACADSEGRDWLPNRHAFTRGCEVTLDVEGVTFQRFEMRLDGPAGNLMRVRGHAENADANVAAESFPGAEIVVVEDVVLVTVEAPAEAVPAPAESAFTTAPAEAEPTPALDEAARPLE